jgi:hypothetical protein
MNPKRTLQAVLHAIAGVGPLFFFAVATVEGSIRAGYDPIAEPISALAIGPRGWVQELNFAVLAASFLSFAVVLRSAFRGGVSSVAGPGVLGIMTIGVAVAGLFTMDVPGGPVTLPGRLHMAGGFLVFPWMPVALLLTARRFRHDENWRTYFQYTRATGILCLATIVFFLLFVGPPGFPRPLAGIAGLVQRLQLIPFFVWIAVVTHRAYRGERWGVSARFAA